MKKTLFLILTLLSFAANAAPDLTKNLVYNGNMEAEYSCSLPPALPKTCTDIPGWKLSKSPGADAFVSFQPNTVTSNRLFLSINNLPPYNYAVARPDKAFVVTPGLYQYWFTSWVGYRQSYAKINIYDKQLKLINFITVRLPKDKKFTLHTDVFIVPLGGAYAEIAFGITAPGWLLIDNVIVNRRALKLTY